MREEVSTRHLVRRDDLVPPIMPPMSIAKNLTKLRSAAGLSQAQLASVSGVSQQLISQIERGINLTTKHLPKLANALGVSVGAIDPEYQGPAPSSRTVKVTGRVQAGEWAEQWQWEDEDFYEVAVPADEDLIGYALYAAETRGTSMNRRYPEGTVLVYTSAIHTFEDIKPGSRYIVERAAADGTLEATVKLVFRDERGKLWLLPESTDPLFQQAIPLEGGEDDTIRIIGKVRFSVAREG